MNSYSLAHLSDAALARDLAAADAREGAATAWLLAHLAEFDARQLYREAAQPSMSSWCVQVLRRSPDAAYRRITAARAARQHPGILSALAGGRLHLSGVLLLAPHLTHENADELLQAAAYKTKSEIELLLASRFPKPDVPEWIRAIGPAAANPPAGTELAPARVELADRAIELAPARVEPGAEATELAPARVQPADRATELAPARVEPWPKVAPLSPGRYEMRLTLDQEAYDDLRAIQALLGPTSDSKDLATLVGRSLKLLRQQLEKRKFAATDRPRRPAAAGTKRPSRNPRHIPARVKRAVWARDQGRCTFVSESGQRCPARAGLELDHVEPVARGGEATEQNLRLRCRAHNQLEAECAFGAGFMHEKREAAQAAATRRGATGLGASANETPRQTGT